MGSNKSIYLDYQATTPVDESVLAVMEPFWKEDFANPHSVDHSCGWQAAQAVEEASTKVGALVGADEDEIFFTSGATEANNMALFGVTRRGAGGRRKRIIISAIEHKCVLATARAIQAQLGFCVEIVPVDRNGIVDVNRLEAMIDDDVLIASIMSINNEIGSINGIEEISSIVRKKGILLHSDCAQSPTGIDTSTFSSHVDMLSLSAHKMYGPKGIGALFIRRDLQTQIEPLIYGGGQQKHLRSGTLPVPLCVGMGAAAEIFNHIDAAKERESIGHLRDRLINGIRSAGWSVEVNGPNGSKRHPGNANLRFRGFWAHDILAALQPRLAASTGSACSTGIPEPSHVLRALGLPVEEAESSIRFSLGRGTTESDVDEAIQMIDEVLIRLPRGNLH